MNTLITERPIVNDAPSFQYVARDRVRLLKDLSGHGTDRIQVVGDPDNASYEWVIRDEAGKIIEYSDSGYGSTLVALRDGLAAYEYDPLAQESRDMFELLKTVAAGSSCRGQVVTRARELLRRMETSKRKSGGN